jgi:ABC-type Fe3+-hydroxamate transport system substrate-binding protein
MKQRLICIFIFIFSSLAVFSKSANTIVSLSPSLTKMVYLLNSQNQLIGCTDYCDIAKKDKKAIVSSAMEVNVEKILMLKPGIVITTKFTKPATIEALKKLGIKVEIFSSPASFLEICDQLIILGKLTGKEPLAQSIVDTQKARVLKIKNSIGNKKKPKIFMEIGAKPLFSATPNTFMDDFITCSGGTNIASDLTIGTISRESVLLRNPDVIIIVTMGVVAAEEKNNWINYKELSATKTGSIFIIDDNKSCSPTPVDFVDIVEQLVGLIYK